MDGDVAVPTSGEKSDERNARFAVLIRHGGVVSSLTPLYGSHKRMEKS